MNSEVLNFDEMYNIEGGKSWWDYCSSAYGSLTNDLAGKIYFGLNPPLCLIAIGIGGTINFCKYEMGGE